MIAPFHRRRAMAGVNFPVPDIKINSEWPLAELFYLTCGNSIEFVPIYGFLGDDFLVRISETDAWHDNI